MDYYIYLQVPEYTKQFALHHFGDKKNPDAINVKDWYILYGYIVDNLQRRTSQNPMSELGNLKLVLPDAKGVRKEWINYMSGNSRRELAGFIRCIMFSNFWKHIMPMWNMMKLQHTKRKGVTMDKCIVDFFDENGIEYTEEASNNFKQAFYRQRARLESEFGVKI